jgi:hypothetical protein
MVSRSRACSLGSFGPCPVASSCVMRQAYASSVCVKRMRQAQRFSWMDDLCPLSTGSSKLSSRLEIALLFALRSYLSSRVKHHLVAM